MKLKVIFPCNPLNRREVDPEYLAEYNAVKLMDGTVRLFDFDQFRIILKDMPADLEGIGDLYKVFSDQSEALEPREWMYRGWMMNTHEYEMFYKLCRESLYMQLINSPAQYNACHMFPLVYSYLKDHAIHMYVQEKSGDEFDYDAMKSHFEEVYGSDQSDRTLFVKDWVKSAKGSKDASIIFDWCDKERTIRTVQSLRESRGAHFNEGYVFKKMMDFQMRPDGYTEEWRAFFVNDVLVSFCPTHGSGGSSFAPPQWLLNVAKKIPSNFYTIDVGVLHDGSMMVIETGDGGVSGLSPDQFPLAFYSHLYAKMKEFDSDRKTKVL